VTYTKEPAPTVQFSTSAGVVSTETYVSNGAHTIPIVTTCTPKGSHFTAPVTTTVWYTTTVKGGPKTVTCTKTVTVTFTSTCSGYPATVISGHTQLPSTAPPSVSATTTHSYPVPTTPTTVGECDFYGCLGSSDGFPTFEKIESSGGMDVELCTSECVASGYSFAGLFTTDCYCAKSIGDASTDGANGVCDLPCLGNPLETCGGKAVPGSHKLYVHPSRSILLDVYECNKPTTTSSTTSSVIATSDPSSDPDPETERRDINADMEPAAPQAAREIKLRRGGLLRNPKVDKGPKMAKRDFGLKKPFGQ